MSQKWICWPPHRPADAQRGNGKAGRRKKPREWVKSRPSPSPGAPHRSNIITALGHAPQQRVVHTRKTNKPRKAPGRTEKQNVHRRISSGAPLKTHLGPVRAGEDMTRSIMSSETTSSGISAATAAVPAAKRTESEGSRAAEAWTRSSSSPPTIQRTTRRRRAPRQGRRRDRWRGRAPRRS